MTLLRLLKRESRESETFLQHNLSLAVTERRLTLAGQVSKTETSKDSRSWVSSNVN